MSTASDPDSERVLAQALRAMAGGRPAGGVPSPRTTGPVDTRHRLTVLQILLIAAIVGVAIGAGTGIVLLVVQR